MLTKAHIEAAQSRIAPFIRFTPMLDVVLPTPSGPVSVRLKLEHLQVTGSFKPRGAFNSLLQLSGGNVIACSGGNHGLAVAHAAKVLNKQAVIFVPKSAAASKVEAMSRTGAEVRQVGDVPAEAFREAEALERESGWPLVHPYDQEPTLAGQGTLGLELLEQAPGVKRWLLAVGGGGFPAAVAMAMAGEAEVIPIEPEGCPSLFEAQKAGHPVPTKAEGIARTSLGPPSLGVLPWEILKDRVGPTALVSDEAIREAQVWLWREARIVAEPGGAAALAALLSGAWAPEETDSIGVVVCGGNADSLPG
ncbi:MAG: serine/threonine dehydratase [Acidobacteriota bacterium]|nr:serine/threonine dehydratase [Acidobacteriota bacterium]